MNRLLHLLAVLAAPVILTALNIHVLATPAYVAWEYDRAGFPEAPGFTVDERLSLAIPSSAFIVSSEPPAVLFALEHDGSPLYVDAEVAHLVDVQRLVRWIDRLALAGLAVWALAGLSWLTGLDRARLASALRRGGWLSIGIVALLAGGVAIAWPFVFTTFHELLFAAGTWQFPIDSGLIRLFPERFWFDSAVALFALTVAESLAIVLLARLVPARPDAAPDA